MPGKRTLPKIKTRWPVANALLKEWHAFVTRLDSWSWGPGFDVRDTDAGRTVNLVSAGGLRRAVVTTAIPVAPDADSVSNTGRATLRLRTGTDLEDGATGQVIYSDWSAEIAVGTRIMIAPDGDGWMLVTADCPA